MEKCSLKIVGVPVRLFLGEYKRRVDSGLQPLTLEFHGSQERINLIS